MKLMDSFFRLINPLTSLDEMHRLDQYVPETDPGSLIDMGAETGKNAISDVWDSAVQAVTGKDADGNPVAQKKSAAPVTGGVQVPQTPTVKAGAKKPTR